MMEEAFQGCCIVAYWCSNIALEKAVNGEEIH